MNQHGHDRRHSYRKAVFICSPDLASRRGLRRVACGEDGPDRFILPSTDSERALRIYFLAMITGTACT